MKRVPENRMAPAAGIVVDEQPAELRGSAEPGTPELEAEERARHAAMLAMPSMSIGGGVCRLVGAEVRD